MHRASKYQCLPNLEIIATIFASQEKNWSHGCHCQSRLKEEKAFQKDTKRKFVICIDSIEGMFLTSIHFIRVTLLALAKE